MPLAERPLRLAFAALAGLACAAAPLPGTAYSADVHDKEYWQAVIATEFALPRDASIDRLAGELSGHLGSPDPELRDDVAYGVLTQWLYVRRIVPPALRRELIDTWLGNLVSGVGEQGTDSVFLRSFSALMLSVAAALDNEQPYLEQAEFDRVLRSALAYLHDEQDTRGFDAEKGWVHSVAHTADLLKFLGRSRHLGVRDQSAILAAISEKLAQVDHVLAFGEDERLARAVLSIAARPDADMTAFAAFLDSLKPVPFDGLPTRSALAANQNRKHLAVSLYALLAVDSRDFAGFRQARESVRELLRTML